MDVIRSIKPSDYPVVSYAWALAGQPCKATEVYPKQSSYVFERDGKLLYCVAVYAVIGAPIAYVEAVVRNPFLPADFDALQLLQDHLSDVYKAKGVKRLIVFAANDHLVGHYARLGYNRVGSFILIHKELN